MFTQADKERPNRSREHAAAGTEAAPRKETGQGTGKQVSIVQEAAQLILQAFLLMLILMIIFVTYEAKHHIKPE